MFLVFVSMPNGPGSELTGLAGFFGRSVSLSLVGNLLSFLKTTFCRQNRGIKTENNNLTSQLLPVSLARSRTIQVETISDLLPLDIQKTHTYFSSRKSNY